MCVGSLDCARFVAPPRARGTMPTPDPWPRLCSLNNCYMPPPPAAPGHTGSSHANLPHHRTGRELSFLTQTSVSPSLTAEPAAILTQPKPLPSSLPAVAHSF